MVEQAFNEVDLVILRVEAAILRAMIEREGVTKDVRGKEAVREG